MRRSSKQDLRGNRNGKQSPIIIAVTNKELRDKLSAMNAKIMGAENDPFYGAPVVLIVLADKHVRHTFMTEASLWEI